ncbi:MAG: HEAT repeat domain-containing protein [Pirellulales bacterium]
MPQVLHLQSERQSVPDLVHAALTEPEDVAWNAVCLLHRRGTRDVFEAAHRLCRSHTAQERRIGADILGQLGIDQRSFPRESINMLVHMLACEPDKEVMQSILVALSHHDAPGCVSVVAPFADHADPWVRHATVLALMGYDDPRAIERLIYLSHDRDAAVRDWATFALGTQLSVDTPDIRRALLDRLHDTDGDTRSEALLGLARRGERLIVPTLIHELSHQHASSVLLEACEMLHAPELAAPLIAMRGARTIDAVLLERAIAACLLAS